MDYNLQKHIETNIQKTLKSEFECNTKSKLSTPIYHLVKGYNSCYKVSVIELMLTMQRNLDEGAESFLEFMKINSHQVLLVPHYGSQINAKHYHRHTVVNVKSYTTGKTLLDKYSELKLICDFMSQQLYTRWKYRYHNCDKIVPTVYF